MNFNTLTIWIGRRYYDYDRRHDDWAVIDRPAHTGRLARTLQHIHLVPRTLREPTYNGPWDLRQPHEYLRATHRDCAPRGAP